MSGEPHMTLRRWLWLGLYCFGGLGLSMLATRSGC